MVNELQKGYCSPIVTRTYGRYIYTINLVIHQLLTRAPHCTTMAR